MRARCATRSGSWVISRISLDHDLFAGVRLQHWLAGCLMQVLLLQCNFGAPSSFRILGRL